MEEAKHSGMKGAGKEQGRSWGLDKGFRHTYLPIFRGLFLCVLPCLILIMEMKSS